MISWIRNQLRKIKNCIYKSYECLRKKAYPSWQDAVQAVKDKNPKP